MSWLRRLHRWLGLALALPLVWQGTTGAVLVTLSLVGSPRPQLLHPDGAARPAPESAEAIVAAAGVGAPAGLVPIRYDPARRAGDTADVAFGHPGSRLVILDRFIDPATRRLVAARPAAQWVGIVRRLHTALLLPTAIGRPIVGWIGVALLGLCLTGVTIWWPRPEAWRSGRWRRNLMVSREARGVRFWRELHRALGGWMLVMLLVMSSTGITLAFPQTARRVLGLAVHPGPAGGARSSRDVVADTRAGLDAAIARTRTALPDAVLASVGLNPAPADWVLRLQLPRHGGLMEAAAGRDGKSFRITRDPRRGGVGEGVLVWMHAIHEATLPVPAGLAGLWSVLTGLAGTSLPLFALTGVTLWLRRRHRDADAARASADPAPEPHSAGYSARSRSA